MEVALKRFAVVRLIKLAHLLVRLFFPLRINNVAFSELELQRPLLPGVILML